VLAPPARAFRPLRVDGAVAGWLTAERAARVLDFGDVFRASRDGLEFVPALADAGARSRALAHVTATLATEGALTRWRDERYAVAADLGDAPWFVLERAAARYFGVRTYAAHVSGLVRAGGDTTMWLARRSAAKAIDPGMLDNLVGGGIAAGATAESTAVKEAWEEAGIPPEIATGAERAATLSIRREQPDGLQWETIFAFDAWLPGTFVPANQDGEVVEHRRVALAEAARLIAVEDGPDAVTADASLVALDCLLRLGAGPADAARLHALASLRHAARRGAVPRRAASPGGSTRSVPGGGGT
jgi:8-oxo-dGTP pyrophosphatase MutT (NUDIX family)